MLPTHRLLPPPVAGYELNPKKGWFNIILPEATANLVANPSFETNTTGYTAVGAAVISRTTDQQRRGAWALKISPSTSGNDGVYYGTVNCVSGTAYTFSLDFKGVGGRQYKIYFASYLTGNQVGAAYSFKATGRWQRVSLSRVETDTQARRVYVTKDGDNSSGLFYIDGLQVEAKAYPTTYCDGEQTGFVPGQQAYLWGGPAHGSVSYRIAETRSGGRVVNLLDYGFHVSALTGLGMPSLDNIATPYATLDGAFYRRTRSPQRQFALVGTLSGNNVADLQRRRAQLAAAFRPDSVSPQQPLLLRFQYADGQTDLGDALDFQCFYAGGLEGNTDNLYLEKLAIAFVAFQPYGLDDGSHGASLNLFHSATINSLGVGSGYNTYRVKNTGVWSDALSDSQAVFTYHTIFTVSFTGQLYATDGSTVWLYDPVQDSVTRILAVSGGTILAMAAGADGRLYIGGSFTTVTYPSTFTAAGIAQFFINPDGSLYADVVGLGVSAGNILALQVDINNIVYLGGNFQSAGGVANTDQIAKANPGIIGSSGGLASYASLGGATNGDVNALALDRDGTTVYIGGDFTTLAGTAAARVASYDGSTVSAMGSGISGGSGVVRSLAVSNQNHLFAGGGFSTAGGNSAANLAEWNGTAWAALPQQLTVQVEPQGMVFLPDGQTLCVALLGVNNDYAGSLRLPSPMALWTGTRWLPFPAAVFLLSGAGVVGISPFFFGADQLAFGFFMSGSAVTYYPAQTVVMNNGLAAAHPKVRFTVQAFPSAAKVYYLENFTTGAKIYFDSLTVAFNEIVLLDLTPGNISLFSNTRGQINEFILPGSDLATWTLAPGENRINLLSYYAGNPLQATMYWNEYQWDIAGGF